MEYYILGSYTNEKEKIKVVNHKNHSAIIMFAQPWRLIEQNGEIFRKSLEKYFDEKADKLYVYMRNNDTDKKNIADFLVFVQKLAYFLKNSSEVYILGCHHYLNDKIKFAEDNGFHFIKTECSGTRFIGVFPVLGDEYFKMTNDEILF
jgi:hypothetical protein